MHDRVLITGHSAGLGLALTGAWLDCGAAVKGLARTSAARYAGSEHFSETAIDLSNSAALITWLAGSQWQQFTAGAERLWLFNNAGTQEPARTLGEQDPDAIAKAVSLNITAPLLLANAAAALAGSMQVNIVHISSGAARTIYPGWSIYSAGKAALNQHAATAAAEENPHLKIAAIAPGVVDTAMQKSIRQNLYFPVRERFLQLHENNLLQSPEETAVKLLSYCLSDDFGRETFADIRNL